MDLSKTSLINRALGFLGEKIITSADNPQTPGGKLLANNYDQVRRDTLYMFPWSFAETWALLNITTPPPNGPTVGATPATPMGYSDAYSLPADFIRLVDLGDPVSGGGRTQGYRFLNQNGQRVIATNNSKASQIACSYIADIQLLSQWSPGGLKVFALQLALDSAKAITGQDQLIQELSQLLTFALQDAVGVEGTQQPKLRQVFSNVQRDRDEAFLGSESFFTPVTGFPST